MTKSRRYNSTSQIKSKYPGKLTLSENTLNITHFWLALALVCKWKFHSINNCRKVFYILIRSNSLWIICLWQTWTQIYYIYIIHVCIMHMCCRRKLMYYEPTGSNNEYDNWIYSLYWQELWADRVFYSTAYILHLPHPLVKILFSTYIGVGQTDDVIVASICMFVT